MKAGAIAGLKQRLLFKADLADTALEQELIALPGFSATGKLPVYFSGRELLAHFNHVGFSRAADMHRVNPKTFAVKTEKLDHWVQDIYPAPGGLLVRERMNGMSIYSDFSTDGGDSWARNEASGPYVMRFLDKSSGYGLSVLNTGWSTVTVALNKTTTGGQGVGQGGPADRDGRPVADPAGGQPRVRLHRTAAFVDRRRREDVAGGLAAARRRGAMTVTVGRGASPAGVEQARPALVA